MTVTGEDAFSRDVYCIQGLPIDAVTMADVVRKIRSAAERGTRLFLSTPNLNFLVGVQDDPDYRETVLASDLNIADGMPIVWIARILGLPVRHRLAGSNLLTALAETDGAGSRPIKVVFFGGIEGAGEAACRAINADPGPVSCAGAIYPGFRGIAELGEDPVIEEVNAFDADFLIVALGARKGQIWLHRNGDRLKAPVRSHLGALINMAAGSIRKAPSWVENAGLEWAWRIREEPSLWRRYLKDGLALVRLVFTRIVPLAVVQRFDRWRSGMRPFSYRIGDCRADTAGAVLVGIAADGDREAVRRLCRDLVASDRDVQLDLEGMAGADPGFFGFLMLLGQELERSGRKLTFSSVAPAMARRFRLNGVAYLLNRRSESEARPPAG